MPLTTTSVPLVYKPQVLERQVLHAPEGTTTNVPFGQMFHLSTPMPTRVYIPLTPTSVPFVYNPSSCRRQEFNTFPSLCCGSCICACGSQILCCGIIVPWFFLCLPSDSFGFVSVNVCIRGAFAPLMMTGMRPDSGGFFLLNSCGPFLRSALGALRLV